MRAGGTRHEEVVQEAEKLSSTLTNRREGAWSPCCRTSAAPLPPLGAAQLEDGSPPESPPLTPCSETDTGKAAGASRVFSTGPLRLTPCLENTAERTNGRRSRSQAPGNKESAGHAAHVQAGRAAASGPRK